MKEQIIMNLKLETNKIANRQIGKLLSEIEGYMPVSSRLTNSIKTFIRFTASDIQNMYEIERENYYEKNSR